MSVKLRKRKLPSGKTQLCLAIGVSRHRRYEALNLFLTKERNGNKQILRLAEAIRAKRELDVHADQEGIASPWRQSLCFFEYAEGIYRNKTPLTRQSYVNALDHLKTYSGEKLTFRDISERLCADFKVFLLGRLKRNTAATYFAKFKSILKSASKEGYIRQNPAADLSIRTVDSNPKFLTYAEIMQLQNALCGNQIIRDAYLFSINTGLRFGDVRDLTWTQIQGNSLTFIQSKTDSPEVMPLSASAELILKRQYGFTNKSNEKGQQVFPLPRRSTVYKVLNTWAKRAGIQKSISFHGARHSFATLMISQGIDIYTVSKLLGHKNVATTQIYAKVLDVKKREAIDKLPSIGAV